MFGVLVALFCCAGASATQCAHVNASKPTGIDYADANVTVVPGETEAACCEACAQWNQHNTDPAQNCTIVVWYNNPPRSCGIKATMERPVKGVRVAALLAPPTPPPEPPVRFANVHSDNMVLQAAPARAKVWGFTRNAADVVSVQIDGGAATKATVVALPGSGGGAAAWFAFLPATPASLEAHTVTATSTGGSAATLREVLFGDVWVCSGQSNMAYSLNGSNANAIVHPPVNDSAREFADMASWPHIRLFRVGRFSASTPQAEVAPTTDGGSYTAVQGWSSPCPPELGGRCRVDFSAMCWFYGRNVQQYLRQQGRDVPIGLIGDYVGGTADELWSSPDALAECLDPKKPVPVTDSSLWNGMLAPLLNTTIKGAIWYQGEADARHPGGAYDGYNCTFPAMIADWRRKWSASAGTDAQFPFGFVQLNSVGNASVYDGPADPRDDYSAEFGYAGLRWSQSAGYGHAPNPAQPNVFMATSVDTPDNPYPTAINGVPGKDQGFNVHSPYKQPTAARLARAGLAVAYGLDVDTVTPLASSAAYVGGDIVLTVKNVGVKNAGAGISIRSTVGFEALAGGTWVSVPVTAHTKDTVTISAGAGGIGGGGAVTRVRYNWYSNPCGEGCFGCAVYVAVKPLTALSGDEPFLPLPPFVMDLS